MIIKMIMMGRGGKKGTAAGRRQQGRRGGHASSAYYTAGIDSGVATMLLIVAAATIGGAFWAGSSGQVNTWLSDTECSIIYSDALVTGHVPPQAPPLHEEDAIKSMRLDVGIRFDGDPGTFTIHIHDESDLDIVGLQTFPSQARTDAFSEPLLINPARLNHALYVYDRGATMMTIDPQTDNIDFMSAGGAPITGVSPPAGFKIFADGSDRQADMTILLAKTQTGGFGESCKSGDECIVLVNVAAGASGGESCSASMLARGNF